MKDVDWATSVNPRRLLGHLTDGMAYSGELQPTPCRPGEVTDRKLCLLALALLQHNGLASTVSRDSIDRIYVTLRTKSRPTAQDFYPTTYAQKSVGVTMLEDMSAYRELFRRSKSQADAIRDVVGPTRGTKAVRPECDCYADRTVLSLAHGAYQYPEDDRGATVLANDRLAVLADALEDAGCKDEMVLMHLRGYAACRCLFDTGRPRIACAGKCVDRWVPNANRHYVGCWVIETILSRGERGQGAGVAGGDTD